MKLRVVWDGPVLVLEVGQTRTKLGWLRRRSFHGGKNCMQEDFSASFCRL